jgi:hypothetical protein
MPLHTSYVANTSRTMWHGRCYCGNLGIVAGTNLLFGFKNAVITFFYPFTHHSIPSVLSGGDLALKHNVPNSRRFVFVIHPEGKEKTVDSRASKKINFEVKL